MSISLKFLGIAQDAGIPQIGCSCKTCKEILKGEREVEYPVALGLINEKSGKKFMIEATPAFPIQYGKLLDIEKKEKLEGILLTHAHIGHYTGLLSLGREALNTKLMKVYTSKKMGDFLRENAPWNQLVKLQNIEIIEFENEKEFILDEGLKITPIKVKHRNEHADTFGFIIEGEKRVFFVPDIDTWEGFEERLEKYLKEFDYLIVDATFYTKDEIGKIRGRELKEIPHPTIEETMKFVLDRGLSPEKIIFTHFNHSNMIFSDDKIRESVERLGFGISKDGMTIEI